MDQRYRRIRYDPERCKFFFAYYRAFKRQKVEQLIERARMRNREWVCIGTCRIHIDHLRDMRDRAKLGIALLYSPSEDQVVWREAQPKKRRA